jgi:toxin secretion/phage lysis holin
MVQFIQIIIACCFHLIDFGTGLLYAVKKKCIKSSKMRDGLFKKMGFIVCYIVCLIIDNYGNYIGFHLDVKILTPIIVYCVTTEIVSIAENISKINPNLLPNKLLSLLHIDGERGEKNE